MTRDSQALQNKLCNTKLGSYVSKYKMEKEINDKINKEHPNLSETDPQRLEIFNEKKKKYNKRHGFTKANKTREWLGKFKIMEYQQKNKPFIK